MSWYTEILGSQGMFYGLLFQWLKLTTEPYILPNPVLTGHTILLFLMC